MGIPEMSRPKYMKKGDKLQIAIKLLSVQNLQQMQEDMKKEHDEQLAKDDKEIKDYLAKNNLQSDKTSEGVYIVTHQAGSGITPQQGSQVKINYTGKSLDGKPFDSNTDTAAQIMHHDLKPMEFTVGEGQVLKGMDDALLQMKKGASATIYIPSGLAYGPKGQPPVIKPNEILAFDIQLLDVNDSARLAGIRQAAQDSVRRARAKK
jgi:FKBP-type peptidyl-prolyl cis-trans isomerase